MLVLIFSSRRFALSNETGVGKVMRQPYIALIELGHEFGADQRR